MSRVLAVCRVHALNPDPGTIGVTAIDKRPVEGPVRVRPLGLYADVQADRKHHGGADKAVYAYAEEEATWWGDELGREIPPGLFGENLRTSGVAVDDAVLGEVWRVGTDGLRLRVTAPRTPCQTFARRMGEPSWVKRFTTRARVGTYLAVDHAGAVAAGDDIEVLERPEHGVTVTDAFVGLTPVQAEALLTETGPVYPDLLDAARRTLTRAGG